MTATFVRSPFHAAIVVVWMATVVALVSCADNEAPDTLARLRLDSAVRVGFADEQPYAYLDGQIFTGSEVAIADEVFARLGIDELIPVHIPFDDLLLSLESGEVDVVVAGMFITPERCARAAFSDPTYAAPQVLAVPRGNPQQLRNYRDVIDRAATLGVLAGAAEAGYALGFGVPPERIVEFTQPTDLVAALVSTQIDAFALTSLSARRLREAAGETFDVTEPFIPVFDGRPAVGAGAFAFRLEDTALRDAVNAELAHLRAEGRLQPLVSPFGMQERELLGAASLTADELCRADEPER